MILGFRITNPRPFLLLINSHLNHSFSTLTSSSPIEEEFLPWLRRKSGVEISTCLTIGTSKYGKSLFATRRISEGECILQIPFSVKLTPYDLPAKIRLLLEDEVGNLARLAIVVLAEQKKGKDSEWAPYISSLPRKGELHSTIFWSDEELEMVQPSLLYMDTIHQKAQMEKDFLMIKPVLDRCREYIDNFTWKDFMHAYALVGSRAWGNNLEGLSLVPFADFLNHDGVCEAVLHQEFDRQISEVIADRNYAPGEQVLIRYGKFTNSTLLGDFGFTVSFNIYAQVEIQFSVSQQDPLYTAKLKLLHKHRVPIVKGCVASQYSFIIKEVRSSRGKGRGIPQTLRAFLRIMSATCAGELQEMKIEAAQNDGRLARLPLKNTTREIQAHQMLLTKVMHLIHEYDASVQILRCKCPSSDIYDAHRSQLALDVLTGELRVLNSAFSWLIRYCATLSAQLIQPHRNLCNT